jgi:hypothetical protein
MLALEAFELAALFRSKINQLSPMYFSSKAKNQIDFVVYIKIKSCVYIFEMKEKFKPTTKINKIISNAKNLFSSTNVA